MRCPQCHFENEEGSKFCGNCGTALGVSQTIRNAMPVSQARELYCASCGAPNPGDSLFCENCGSKLASQQGPGVSTGALQYATTGKKTSAAWWLMPIFLGWIGGIVAWLVVRENDKSKARRLLWTGIAITAFWFILGIVGSLVSYSFANV